jgi:hypothetical protein
MHYLLETEKTKVYTSNPPPPHGTHRTTLWYNALNKYKYTGESSFYDGTDLGSFIAQNACIRPVIPW